MRLIIAPCDIFLFFLSDLDLPGFEQQRPGRRQGPHARLWSRGEPLNHAPQPEPQQGK